MNWFVPNRRVAAFLSIVAISVGAAGKTATAETVGSSALRGSSILARPIGGAFAGGHVGGGPMGGPLLGVEGGWATTLAAGNDVSQGSASFGVRAGWSFPNGIALHARYDDLGVEPASSRTPLQLATMGLRYSVPFFVPMPFAEVDAGPAFAAGGVWFGAGASLGVSIPIAGLVLIDLVGRDWFVPINETLRQTLTVDAGLTVLFPAPGGR